MVVTIKSLEPLYAVFKFKLNFRNGRAKLKRDLVHDVRGQAIVSPPEKQLVALVLEFVLPSLEIVC